MNNQLTPVAERIAIEWSPKSKRNLDVYAAAAGKPLSKILREWIDERFFAETGTHLFAPSRRSETPNLEGNV